MNLPQTPYMKVALAFASALVAEDFESAYQLLSTTAKLEWSPLTLKSTYLKMVEYFETHPDLVEVILTMEDWKWPTKQPEDIGWVYVSIPGDGESEAVTVIVCAENDRLLVRYIEWGRP